MSTAAAEQIHTDSLRPLPKCPRCGFPGVNGTLDERSFADHGYCSGCRCEVIARDNDDGDVPPRIAELGVSCFEFEKEVAYWTAFYDCTHAHAVGRAISLFELLAEEAAAKAAEKVLATVPELALTPPAEIATLDVHDGCDCTRSTVCRPCVVGHYARQGCTWHEGYDRTIASLTPAELEAWHARIRADIEAAALADDEEFPAVCDARLQGVIDHQTNRYLAGDDVADALAEMRALHNERVADDRRAFALLEVAS